MQDYPMEEWERDYQWVNFSNATTSGSIASDAVDDGGLSSKPPNPAGPEETEKEPRIFSSANGPDMPTREGEMVLC